MAWLILVVGIIAAVLLCGRWLLSADPKLIAKIMKWTGGILAGFFFLFLLLSGRFAFALPLLLLAPMLLRRRRMLAGMLRAGKAPSTGQKSDVETATIRMTLDHDSGDMHGTVLRSPYAGRNLESLELGQLIELMRDCVRDDQETVPILEAYLDRIHGDTWREEMGESAGAASSGDPMTMDEALEILGLETGASAEDVREAHHRLMLKMHPDQGGSTYLASKINQAKEMLLKSL